MNLMGRTAHVCEVIELAAARLMRKDLSAFETSVAVRMSLNHVAAGHFDLAKGRVVATRIAIRGRLHEFRVDVFDDTGLVASGEHTRAVVVERRVEAIARRRSGRPAMLLRP